MIIYYIINDIYNDNITGLCAVPGVVVWTLQAKILQDSEGKKININ